ncbi:MAG TPA: hypothetical protein VFE25_06225 [Opitutaceae bacterium]|nr:hypothetical protein [Opitutaceae bacterium]
MKIRIILLGLAGIVGLNPAGLAADFPPVPTAHPTEPPTPTPAAPKLSPYGAIQSLVGGTWSGLLPAGPDGVAPTIDLHFAWAENRHGVRFASTIVKGNRRVPYVSGMYAWNAAKHKLEMFYTDSTGSLTEGTVAPEGNVLVHELTEANSDGSVDSVRVKLTKVDDDVFTNEIFLLADGNYAKIAEVRYEREPDYSGSHQP